MRNRHYVADIDDSRELYDVTACLCALAGSGCPWLIPVTSCALVTAATEPTNHSSDHTCTQQDGGGRGERRPENKRHHGRGERLAGWVKIRAPQTYCLQQINNSHLIGILFSFLSPFPKHTRNS